MPEWKTLTTVPLLTARWGESEQIDATRKWPEEDFTRPWPDEIVMDQGIKALVDRRWKEYGLE